MRLDKTLDEQLNTIRTVPTSSKVIFDESHMVTNKYLIREEVYKARWEAGPSSS